MTNWEGTYTIERFYKKQKSLECYPQLNNIIDFQLKFYDWWKKSKSEYVIRQFRGFPRANLFNMKGITFLTSDNEACASFYEQCYRNTNYKIDNLFHFFKDKNLTVSFKLDKENDYDEELYITDAKSYEFKTGMAIGEPFRTKHKLKLSHYISAAEGLMDTTPKKRCGIFLSPLNVILTPSTRHFKHSLNYKSKEKSIQRNDIGEHQPILEILQSFLFNDIILLKNGSEALKAYCEICDIDFSERETAIDNDIRKSIDYELIFKKLNTLSKPKSKAILKEPTQNKLKYFETDTFIPKMNLIKRKNFILSKNLIGQNAVIEFEDKYDNTIQYNHDYVLKQLGDKITGLPCWDKYGYYTNSKKLPKFVEGLKTVKIF